MSEFDTLAELRADIHERVRTVVEAEADRRFRSSVLDALGAELQTPVPDALVQSRLQSMTRSLSQTLQSRGIALEDYLRVTGMTTEDLVADMRTQAQDLVRKDLALEAVVAAEGIEVSDEMVEAWVREQAAEADEDVETAVRAADGRSGHADGAAAGPGRPEGARHRHRERQADHGRAGRGEREVVDAGEGNRAVERQIIPDLDPRHHVAG